MPWLIFDVRQKMRNRLAASVVLFLSLMGCALPSKLAAGFAQAMAAYVGQLLEPAFVAGLGSGAYWSQAKKWPSSLDQIASVLGSDLYWKGMLRQLSNVAFEPKSDGSLLMHGIITPPKTQQPFAFEVIVTMKSDPTVASGWSTDVRATASEGQAKPNKVPEPTPRPVMIRAEPRITPGRVVAHL